ncbi:MAG: hypothetical protein HY898_07115 [Deltaproteobacteria bacterium]|nr:hypothetical protein [Deltaproteobacteria bacterium]
MRRCFFVAGVIVAIASVGFVACSSSDSSPGGGNPATGGSGGTAGAAGTGGAGTGGAAGTATGGSAGTSGTGGVGGSAGTAGTGGTSEDGGDLDAPVETGGDAPFEAGSGACTNTADLAIIQGSTDFQTKVGDCAKSNMGADPATKNCIIQQTGISDACATCFGAEIKCAASKCMVQCIADSNSQPCKDCRAQNCDPAFTVCSGLPAN